MGSVDRCLQEDVPAVAELHDRVFYGGASGGSEGLRAYYREIFFRNPWYEEKLPSLVYRDRGGVKGFLGCVPRRMEMDGRAVTVAILHRLMVAPDVDSPLAALRLVQGVLEGPQELTLADGANDGGRKILAWSGASESHLYGMKWFRALRPCSLAVELLAKRWRRAAPVAWVARPAAMLADTVLCGVNGSPFALGRPATTEVRIRADLLLRGMEEFSRNHVLRPTYDVESLGWLLDVLRGNRHRGAFDGIAIFGAGDAFIGLCLYYVNAARIAEVMLLAARDDSRDAVLRHVLHRVWERGGVGLVGRLEPRFLPAFSDHGCLMKVGDWAFVHAKNPELVQVIDRGDAFLSGLEGELWLRSPMDRL